jgi:hypothetical protein
MPPQPQPDQPVYDVEELAREWKVKPDTVRFALRRRRIIGSKIGKDWRVTAGEKARVERGETAA